VRRVRSTLGNASNLGVFLVLATPLAIARVREERAGWRWVSWVAVGSGAVVLALSLSRGAWAGAAAGAVCWLVSEARRWDQARRVKVGLASLLVGVAAVALVVGVVPNAGARVAELADPSAGTAGWRTVVWSQSLRMVADRPLLGFGPGSFRYAFPQYRTAATMTGEGGAQVLEDPHNILVSAAVATGVPGLLVLVALLATIFGAAWRIDEGADAEPGLAGPAIIAALAGGFAALQFHFFTLDTLPLFAALAGLALAHAESASAGREVPGLPGSIAAVRWIAALVAGVLTAASLAAGGLVLADYAVASGFGLVGTGAPWAAARAEFERARALAPWEPALQWALGRAATQRISSAHETAAFPDAEAAMLSAGRRLPADPLLVAQTSELYLVEGLATQDREAIQRSLVLAERAIALDPQNGYRWETKGTALAALGDSAGAVTALRTSVGYSPEDSGAWASLAAVYRRLGDTVSAAVAQARADALTNRP